MTFKITFKNGKVGTVKADSHEETETFHLFHRENDEPLGGKFVLKDLVADVQPYDPPKSDFVPSLI